MEGESEPTAEQDQLNTDIPDFVRAWDASVRRPAILPEPATYHEAIDPSAIFELNVFNAEGHQVTILVVRRPCQYCAQVAQACSRAFPTCLRCTKAKRPCARVMDGYVKLPGPKVSKPRKNKPVESGPESCAGEDAEDGEILHRDRKRPKKSIPAKRSVSPRGNIPPKKRSKKGVTDTSVLTPQHKGPTIKATEKLAAPSASVDTLLAEHPDPKWTFIKPSSKQVAQSNPDTNAPPRSPLTGYPRAWIHSRTDLLALFPNLKKRTSGLAWVDSETPILIIHDSYPQDTWSGPLSLNISMLWNYVCGTSALRPPASAVVDGTLKLDSCVETSSQPPDEVETRRLADAPNPSNPEECTAPIPAHNALASCGNAQQAIPRIYSYAPGSFVTYAEPQQGETQVRLSANSSHEHSPWSCPGTIHGPDTPTSDVREMMKSAPVTASDKMMTHTRIESAVEPGEQTEMLLPASSVEAGNVEPSRPPSATAPIQRPPDIEVLFQAKALLVPVLIWCSGASHISPCLPSSEHAYACLGYFFISALHEEIVDCVVDNTNGTVRGAVRWHFDLEWAPGGEEFLLDNTPGEAVRPAFTTRDISRPWWAQHPSEMEVLSAVESYAEAAEELESETQTTDDIVPKYRPRDIRSHYYSHIALDLLAQFEPSECFPRGWFCRQCGLINIQTLFRHQICQSSVCKASPNGSRALGKPDPLFKLRDMYSLSMVTRPLHNVPHYIDFEEARWDTGIETYMYLIKENVRAFHVFTGNKEELQQDADTFLEDIQRDVILSREDGSRAFFTFTTAIGTIADQDPPVFVLPRDVPKCIARASLYLANITERYGQLEKPCFGRISILAWTATGTRKWKVLRAKRTPIVMLCLGAEVTLNFVPKGGYQGIPVVVPAVTIPRDRPAAAGSSPLQASGLPPQEWIDQVMGPSFQQQVGFLLSEERADLDSSTTAAASGLRPSEETCDVLMDVHIQSNGSLNVELNNFRTPWSESGAVDLSAADDSGTVASTVSEGTPDVIMEEQNRNNGSMDVGLDTCALQTEGQADAGSPSGSPSEPPDVVMAKIQKDGFPCVLPDTFTSRTTDQGVDSWLAGGGPAVTTKEIPDVVMEGAEVQTNVGHDMTQGPIRSDMVVPTQGKGKGKDKDNTAKAKKSIPAIPAFSLTLVHGDSVILTGDDYECQIERTGITLLVFGSEEGA
ncbi:hypothetical protein V8B97DRAFT_1982678, partial [Scleroderma yunnanense]